MAVRSFCQRPTGQFGRFRWIEPSLPALLVGAAVMLSACQSTPPVVEAAPLPPDPPAAPVKAAARARPRRADASCLTAARKHELFQQFAALQQVGINTADGAVPKAAPLATPHRGCMKAEK